MANNGIDADCNDRITKDAIELENILIALDQVQQTVEVMHATVARLKNRIHANLEADECVHSSRAIPESRSTALQSDRRATSAPRAYRKRVTH